MFSFTRASTQEFREELKKEFRRRGDLCSSRTHQLPDRPGWIPGPDVRYATAMADSTPLIALEEGGRAAVLSYNVPDPSSYSGRNFIELDFAPAYFTEAARNRPDDGRDPVEELDIDTLVVSVNSAMRRGFASRRLFPNVRLEGARLRLAEEPDAPEARARVESDRALSHRLVNLSPEEVAENLAEGYRLNVYELMDGTLTHNFIREPREAVPKIYLVETYRLSSFASRYGAGRIVKTFTLLPGEKTKISVKTFLKTESERKSASSVLDSFTTESAKEFEDSVAAEQSDKSEFKKSFEYHAEAEAKASWGWGSANVSGGVKGGSNAAREEFSKNVTNATRKHTSKASAKRDVQVNTSFEVTEQAGEETSIEREIENLNVGRTLNFVFRQMNQEFVTLLHLVDVRIAFFNGFSESRKEVSLAVVDSLLEEYIVEDKRVEVRAAILGQLGRVLDYRDDPHTVLETIEVDADDGYTRFRRDLRSTYNDPDLDFSVAVDGIIQSVSKNSLRTEGMIVDSLMGQGDALDEYAESLQESDMRLRKAQAGAAELEVERGCLLHRYLADGAMDKAALLAGCVCSAAEEKDDVVEDDV